MNCFSAILPFALAVAAVGQSQPTRPTSWTPPERLEIRAQQHDDGPTQLWAAGRGYKVSFHDGMTFVPYATVAGKRPSLAWTTVSVRVGEHELLDAGRAATPRCSDFRAEFDLGAVVEAYDVLAEGLEQTFVIARRPAASGPLTIRGALTTTLGVEAVAARHQSVLLRDERGDAIVEYGAAVAVDAVGVRFPMTTAVEGGDIVLSLDATSMAAATFPLVVDPLLSEVSSTTLSANNVIFDNSDTAVARGVSTKRVLQCFAFGWGGVDYDLYCYACDSDLSNPTLIYRDLSTEDSMDVSCGFVRGANRWVIAWSAHDAFGVSRVRAHVHTVDDDALGTVTRAILNVAGVEDWRPDVGGSTHTSDTDALVVFQRENFGQVDNSVVMGALLDTSTTYGTWTTPFQISGAGDIDAERPSVNKQAEGGSGFWVVVDQEYNNFLANDDYDLVGRRVSAAGAVLPGTWTSDFANATPAVHQLVPVVEGQNGRYAVLFGTQHLKGYKPVNQDAFDVYLECFEWDANSVTPSAAGDRAPVWLEDTFGDFAFPTGLAFDEHTRSHWVPTWQVSPYGAGSAGRYSICAHDGETAIYGQGVGSAAGGTYYNTISDVSVAFDPLAAKFRLHYAEWYYGTVTSWERALIPPLGIGASHFGSACGPISLELGGPAPPSLGYKNAWLGTRDVYLAGTSSAATDLHLVLVGFSTLDVPLGGPLFTTGCSLLVPLDDFGFLPLQIGAWPIWPLALPFASVQQATLHFQDWVYDTTTDQFSSSDRLSVTFGR